MESSFCFRWRHEMLLWLIKTHAFIESFWNIFLIASGSSWVIQKCAIILRCTNIPFLLFYFSTFKSCPKSPSLISPKRSYVLHWNARRERKICQLSFHVTVSFPGKLLALYFFSCPFWRVMRTIELQKSRLLAANLFVVLYNFKPRHADELELK